MYSIQYRRGDENFYMWSPIYCTWNMDVSGIYVDIYRVFITHTMLLVVYSYHYEKCKVITLLLGACLDLGLPHTHKTHYKQYEKSVSQQTSKLLHETT